MPFCSGSSAIRRFSRQSRNPTAGSDASLTYHKEHGGTTHA